MQMRVIRPNQSRHSVGAWPEPTSKDLPTARCDFVGLDLNEVNPGPAGDDEDSWDAIVGARLLYRMIGTALLTRR